LWFERSGFFDESLENALVFGVVHQFLRVPLHPDEKWLGWQFHRFDQIVFRHSAGGCQLAGKPADALVVQCVHPHFGFAVDAAHLASFSKFHAVEEQVAGFLLPSS